LILDVDTNAERVLEVLNASRLERCRKLLRHDAVGHAHCVLGVKPRGVVVLVAEGTFAEHVLKARADLPEPAVRAVGGEECCELLLARRVQRVVDVDAAHGRDVWLILLTKRWEDKPGDSPRCCACIG
jgi:hypothetical protein